MTLGEKIYTYRKKCGLSQEELAIRASVSRQSVSLWETDQTIPSLENLKILATIFGVGLNDLLMDSSEIREADGSEKKEAADLTVDESESNAESSASNEDSLTNDGFFDDFERKFFGDIGKTSDLDKLPEKVLASANYTVEKALNKKIIFKAQRPISVVLLLLSFLMLLLTFIEKNSTFFGIFFVLLMIYCIVVALRITSANKFKEVEFWLFFRPSDIKIYSRVEDRASVYAVKYADISKKYITQNTMVFFTKYGYVCFDLSTVKGKTDFVRWSFGFSSESLKKQKTNKNASATCCVLLFASIAALFGSLAIVAFTSATIPWCKVYPFACGWVFLCFLPIPIVAIIFGVKNKKRTKWGVASIVVAVIVCVYMLPFGLISVAVAPQNSYADATFICSEIGIDLPQNGYAVFSNNSNYDGSTTYLQLNVAFDNDADLSNFENSLDSDSRWKDSVYAATSEFGGEPGNENAALAIMYNKFYCAVPNSAINSKYGEYNFILVFYNNKNQTMCIKVV